MSELFRLDDRADTSSYRHDQHREQGQNEERLPVSRLTQPESADRSHCGQSDTNDRSHRLQVVIDLRSKRLEGLKREVRWFGAHPQIVCAGSDTRTTGALSARRRYPESGIRAGRWLVAVRVPVARGNRGRSDLATHAARGAQVGRWTRAPPAFARASPTDDFSSIRWSWFT